MIHEGHLAEGLLCRKGSVNIAVILLPSLYHQYVYTCDTHLTPAEIIIAFFTSGLSMPKFLPAGVQENQRLISFSLSYAAQVQLSLPVLRLWSRLKTSQSVTLELLPLWLITTSIS